MNETDEVTDPMVAMRRSTYRNLKAEVERLRADMRRIKENPHLAVTISRAALTQEEE